HSSGCVEPPLGYHRENQTVRRTVRTEFQRYATISSRVVETKRDEAAKYSNYFDYAEKLSRASSHRILAIRRAEREGLMKVSIDVDSDTAIEKISRIILKRQSASSELISRAIKDAYKRLIKPSIENEFARISKDLADESAIEVFSSNLRQLLMQAPLGEKRVLGVDPGFRTGCKIVCLDENGKLLHNDVIYPNQPKSDFRGAAKKISTIIESYKIDAIAIGNGTASRETEKFFQSLRYGANMQIFVVSEDGASIYSASKLAREEFPDKDVTVRGAVSIGRRLIDPLAELVKIDPKSIGVGQYQYDVDQNKLQQSLNFTVESCVNTVGVNVNTASKELLGYVSGLGPSLAGNIVKYRQEHGSFRNRSELLKVDRLGPKAFQQASGFLRIIDGDNPLDSTFVHPESYPIVKQMAKDCNCSLKDFVNDTSKRASIDLNKYVSSEHGLTTLQSIINEIGCRGIDPRHKADTFAFDERINTLSELKEGMVVNGIVSNITQFGAFVDIGIKENGLIHISEMSDNYISSPNDVLRINQHLQVKVISIDESRKRISLSLKGL
ncbi:MAG: helix-hairpin-helix domain-containing protein, partial [Muribaculaceae bacterium]